MKNWISGYNEVEIECIEDMPKDTVGFVYEITFTDNTKYIGKKHIYNKRVLKQLDSGPRKNSIKTITRNTGKGYRQTYDVIRKESNWKTYKGSAKECKNKEVKERIILEFCKSEYELTYYEVYYQFANNVLFDDTYINDNILGKFYRNKLKGE